MLYLHQIWSDHIAWLARSVHRFWYDGPWYSDWTSSYIQCPWISSLMDQLIYPQLNTNGFNGQWSTRSALNCSIPQRSVLWSILFLLDTADVTAIAEHHRLCVHSYVDDTQLYAHFKPASHHEWSAHIALYIEEIEKSNRPKSKHGQKKFFWLAIRQQLAKVQCQTVSTIQISAEVMCRRVVLDSEQKFDTYKKRLSGCCFYHLRQQFDIWLQLMQLRH